MGGKRESLVTHCSCVHKPSSGGSVSMSLADRSRWANLGIREGRMSSGGGQRVSLHPLSESDSSDPTNGPPASSASVGKSGPSGLLSSRSVVNADSWDKAGGSVRNAF